MYINPNPPPFCPMPNAGHNTKCPIAESSESPLGHAGLVAPAEDTPPGKSNIGNAGPCPASEF